VDRTIKFLEFEKRLGEGEGGKNEGDESFDQLPNRSSLALNN
jgi:hypothetical protein